MAANPKETTAIIRENAADHALRPLFMRFEWTRCYWYSENKGASYCEADLRLCFRIGKNLVFSCCGLNCFDVFQIVFMASDQVCTEQAVLIQDCQRRWFLDSFEKIRNFGFGDKFVFYNHKIIFLSPLVIHRMCHCWLCL